MAYDIAPEGDDIIKADYLTLDLPYKQGRVVVGNPPFGTANNLSKQFFKKSIQIADAVAFILPISQMNNSDSLYQFDLIHSVDLGKIPYSGILIHCCFNIYIRPSTGLNKKPKVRTDLFKILETRQKGFDEAKEDFKILAWGTPVGKLLTENDTHKSQYKIVVRDKKDVDWIKEKILSFN